MLVQHAFSGVGVLFDISIVCQLFMIVFAAGFLPGCVFAWLFWLGFVSGTCFVLLFIFESVFRFLRYGLDPCFWGFGFVWRV